LSVSEIPAATIAAVASLVTAISSPFVAIFMFIMGRKVDKIGEQTDGLSKALVDAAGKAGHAKGSAEATHTAEVKADALAQGQAEGRAEGRKPENFRGPSE
jgi:hypothetical protein